MSTEEGTVIGIVFVLLIITLRVLIGWGRRNERTRQ